MSKTTDKELTLTDVIKKIDKVSTEINNLIFKIEHISTKIVKLSADIEKFNDRFSNSYIITKWVVQLAFTLIASATITIIISSVFRR